MATTRRRKNVEQSKENEQPSTAQANSTEPTANAGSSVFEIAGVGLISLTTSAIVASTMMRLGPQYLEPVYGNVLPYINYQWYVLASVLYGAALGAVYCRRNITAGPKRLGMAISHAFDLICIMMATAPLRLKYMFSLVETLGPNYGPHIIQLTFGYPVFIAIGFIMSVVSFWAGYSPVSPSRSLVTVFGAFLGQLLICTAGYTYVTPQRSCEAALLLGVNVAIASIIIKLVTEYFVGVNTTPAGQTQNQDRKKSKSGGLNIRIWPIAFCIATGVLTMFTDPQCARAVTPSHQKNPLQMVLSRAESATGWVDVVATEKAGHKMKVLRSGHSIVGGIWEETSESIFGVFYYMDAVKYARDPKAKGQERALQIGLGAGITTRSLYNENVLVDIVELDPAVYQAAIDYFKVPKEITAVYLQDGRKFMEDALDHTYDYIVHDVFTGGSVPAALFSKEALQHAKRILKPGGILSLNFVGEVGSGKSFDYVVRTLRSVFSHIRCFADTKPDGDSIANIVFFASDRPIKFHIPDHIAKPRPSEQTTRTHILSGMMDMELDIDKYIGDNSAGEIITDTYNPLSQFQIPSAIKHWQIMRDTFPSTFWNNY
ncbi:hypothetical protein H4219_001524 [Mycoemilia scoparia]|uniref:PABS domain-containing protein n=1 Tax=Mycoemilia scoparia TaxID=417184 RepID=A0A9W8A9C4_9FUNG|nr:hypothetical protein H4219_001524 [Mycoemilia scoparia]